jgi:hypothetical protein
MSGRDSFRPYSEAHFASGSRKCAVFAQLAPTQNHLLAALPVEDYERLLPDTGSAGAVRAAERLL